MLSEVWREVKANRFVVMVLGPNEVKEALRFIEMKPESRVDHGKTRFEGLPQIADRNINQGHQE